MRMRVRSRSRPTAASRDTRHRGSRRPRQARDRAHSGWHALTAEHDKRQRQFNVVERGVRSMERLVTDLLDVARIESGTFAIRKERVDTNALLHEAVELCAPQGLAMHVAVAAEVPDDVKPMHADRDRLLQVLSNLLGNALKFSDAETKVVVCAANIDGAV